MSDSEYERIWASYGFTEPATQYGISADGSVYYVIGGQVLVVHRGELTLLEAMGCVALGLPAAILSLFTRGAGAAGSLVGGGTAATCWGLQGRHEPDEDDPEVTDP